MPDIQSVDDYRRLVRKGVPTLFEFLTREEFQLCWALVFVENSEELEHELPLADYATPEAPASLEEDFRRAIRYLADNGYHFRGLSLDGWEIMGHLPPIEPRNLAYHLKFVSGSMPSPAVALQAAIPALRDLGLESAADRLREALEGVLEAQKETFLAEAESWN